jgi:hypothetical protein
LSIGIDQGGVYQTKAVSGKQDDLAGEKMKLAKRFYEGYITFRNIRCGGL